MTVILPSEPSPDLGTLIDLLRAKGVAEFHGVFGGVPLIVKFAPTADSTPAATQPAVDADLCACGHAEHQHTNGLCVMGCAPEKCLGEAKP